MRKRLAAGGTGGGDGRGEQGGRGGRRGRRGCRQTGAPTVLTAPWPEPYKPLYYYAAKQPANPVGTVPYIVDVNAAPLFSEYYSPSLVRARTAGGEQLGASALFAAMPRAGEPKYDADREMFDIIHEGGGGREKEEATRTSRWKTQIPPNPATASSSSPTTRRPHNSPTPRPVMEHNNSSIGRGEEEEDGDDNEPDDTVSDPKKKGRGESFNTGEDELLCDAWLATSLDLVHGTEQKDTTFWRNIHIWVHEHTHLAPYSPTH